MKMAERDLYLTAERLRIGYRSKGHDICIAEVSDLKIHTGDFICLLGSNGVGKSTLIRTLAGIQAPLQGTLHLGNQVYEELSPRERARKVSVVLTEIPPLGMLNADSLVALGRHPHSGQFGTLGSKDRERIDQAFQAVNATNLRGRQVAQLSDGERQKLLIARALAQDTSLILLDEPTAFLDLPRRLELMTTLRKLAHQESMGILLSTHDLDLALRFADHIWLLDEQGTLTKGYPEVLAVTGEIGRAFSKKPVTWDAENATFYFEGSTGFKASIKGDGTNALWTKQALRRFGFTFVETAGRGDLSVRISTKGQEPKWHVGYNGCEEHLNSIEDFIGWVSLNFSS